MTPKEKAEELKIQFDMVIYTDQNHDEQVKQCAYKSAYNVYLSLSLLDDYINCRNDKIILNEKIEFWENVIKELE
jgi:hypothetical protein